MSVNTTNLSHTEAVKALIEKVRALQAEIPNLVPRSTPDETRRMNSAASVPPQFVELAAAAVENTPVLALTGSDEPGVVRDLVHYGEAYTVLAEELESLARTLRNSVATAKNRAGRFALNTYALSARLAQQPENADTLLPIADALRRTLGRTGIGAKKVQADTPPAPATSPK